MKALLIDPKARTITEVEHDDTLDGIKRLIECGDRPITAVYLPTNDVIYLDDEGLYQNHEDWFCVAGFEQPLAGRGLVLGIAHGDGCDVHIKLDELKPHITWRRLRYEGAVHDSGETTLMGRPAHFIRSTPVFREIK